MPNNSTSCHTWLRPFVPPLRVFRSTTLVSFPWRNNSPFSPKRKTSLTPATHMISIKSCFASLCTRQRNVSHLFFCQRDGCKWSNNRRVVRYPALYTTRRIWHVVLFRDFDRARDVTHILTGIHGPGTSVVVSTMSTAVPTVPRIHPMGASRASSFCRPFHSECDTSCVSSSSQARSSTCPSRDLAQPVCYRHHWTALESATSCCCVLCG